VNNKKSLMDIAKAAGIPTPITYQPDKCPDESFLQRLSGTFRLPVVVKLAEDSGLYLPPAQRYCIVNHPDELAEAWTRMHRLKPFPLIQEYIPGEGYGFSALMDNQSDIKAFFCHKRLREYPLSGGPSVLCQSIYNPALVESGTRLLKAVGWQGVAMVEFRKDKRDNTYKLMEINPRFWGSLPLATYSGVNFPDLLCRWASGKAFQPVLNYRLSAKVRFALLDLLVLYERLKRGQISSLYNFIADSFDADIKEGLWDWSDPRPFFAYIRNSF
jgi:predicted ATP-grasp superfamily ATP-dependent carboligase